MASDFPYKPEEIIDFKIPPPVGSKLSTFEIIFDTAVIILWFLLAFVYTVFWVLIWFCVGVPIFVVLLGITYFIDWIYRLFKREISPLRS